MNSKIIASALRTIQSEAESIAALGQHLTDAFEKAVTAIHASSGRLVVTGVGKSAIVGQKMVATFNSTGTPALFMHAADAVHGDLGMIQKEDIVIIISKSGESPEIKTLLPLVKNSGNKVIAITGNIYSYLALQSDMILDTTVSRESCPNNLSPTNSTTAQMVMGDALAVALMEEKGFTDTDFARFHPGGNLGRKLYLRTGDLYKQNMRPSVKETDVLKEVIIEISKGRLGATAVVDAEDLIRGIITDGDVRRLLEKTETLSHISAGDILNGNPKVILPDALATEALERMRTFDISQLIVVNEENRYLGMLHIHDLIREGIL